MVPGRSQSRHNSASKPWEIQRRKVRDHGAKPSNDRWSKGRQEGGKAKAMNHEETSASVSERDKQAEEDLWQRHKAERGVWTEPMLAALERGLKGNKWFSLIDKVRSVTVGIPNGRLSTLPGFSIHTRLTALG